MHSALNECKIQWVLSIYLHFLEGRDNHVRMVVVCYDGILRPISYLPAPRSHSTRRIPRMLPVHGVCGHVYGIYNTYADQSCVVKILRGDRTDGSQYRSRTFLGTDGAPITLEVHIFRIPGITPSDLRIGCCPLTLSSYCNL